MAASLLTMKSRNVSCLCNGYIAWTRNKPLLLLRLLLLLLSRFSHVWLCATPETAAHQAPPSLGFSRQEHWSGLPFPSPMHESEKWKWSCSVVSNSVTPWTAAYQAPPSMRFARQEAVGNFFFFLFSYSVTSWYSPSDRAPNTWCPEPIDGFGKIWEQKDHSSGMISLLSSCQWSINWFSNSALNLRCQLVTIETMNQHF